MEKINQEQIDDAIDQIELTETWVKQYLWDSVGRELIEAALADLKDVVRSGEVPE